MRDLKKKKKLAKSLKNFEGPENKKEQEDQDKPAGLFSKMAHKY